MNRETLKTILGLAVIVLIVVATFLYGNAQRQAQLKRDQDVRAQQAATSSSSPSTAQSPNVAPVGSPTANAIQGGQTSSAATVVGGVNTTAIPQTGPASSSLIGLAALSSALVIWRRSRRAIEIAIRSRG